MESIIRIQFFSGTPLKKGWYLDLNWEKDIGEPLWYNHEGVNYIAINLTIKEKGELKKLNSGKYDLNIGKGLFFGTSYRINNPYFLSYKPSKLQN